MEGLSAKVFRTYNASMTLQDQLNKLEVENNVAAKVLGYNRANRAVAILCNHQVSFARDLRMSALFMQACMPPPPGGWTVGRNEKESMSGRKGKEVTYKEELMHHRRQYCKNLHSIYIELHAIFVGSLEIVLRYLAIRTNNA